MRADGVLQRARGRRGAARRRTARPGRARRAARPAVSATWPRTSSSRFAAPSSEAVCAWSATRRTPSTIASSAGTSPTATSFHASGQLRGLSRSDQEGLVSVLVTPTSPSSCDTAIADDVRPHCDTCGPTVCERDEPRCALPAVDDGLSGHGGRARRRRCVRGERRSHRRNRRTFSWGRVGRPADPTRDHSGPRHARSGRAMAGGARYDRRGMRAFSVQECSSFDGALPAACTPGVPTCPAS